MFLKIVDFIAEWLGPVMVLLGLGGWVATRSGYAIPANVPIGILPTFGLVFCVLGLLAAFEEKKRLNIVVQVVAIVLAVGFLAYTTLVHA